jgi:hypothetical protein
VGGVPTTNVSAVVIEVTASNSSNGGSLSILADDQSLLNTTALSYPATKSASGFTIAKIGADGGVSITSNQGTPDVSVTVEGYFTADGASSGSGGYAPLNQVRIFDDTASPIPAGATVQLQVAGHNGVPSSANAVFANLTASAPLGGSGGLILWPSEQSQPIVSTMRWNEGVASSGASINLGASGLIDIANTGNEPVALTIDLDGYFANGSGTAGGGFFPIDDPLYKGATATADQLAGGGTVRVEVANAASDLPNADTMTAVAVAVTVNNTSAPGSISVYAADAAAPSTSDLSYTAEDDISALTLSSTGGVGAIDVHNSGAASVDITVDTQGYFSNGDPTPAPYFIDGTPPANCTPDLLLSTQYETPDGQMQSAPISTGAQVLTYDDGQGGTFQTISAPNGFDPATATDAQLEMYGIAPRPLSGDGLATWNDQYANFQGYMSDYPCDSGVTNGFTSESSTGNWAGEHVYGPHNTYNEVATDVSVPTYNGCSSGPGAVSHWVGMMSADNSKLVQSGISTQSVDLSRVNLWWEEIGPGRSNRAVNIASTTRADSVKIGISAWHNGPTTMKYSWYNYHKNYAWTPVIVSGRGDWSGDSGVFITERAHLSGEPNRLLHFSDVSMSRQLVFWGPDASSPSGGFTDPGHQNTSTYVMTSDATYNTHQLANLKNIQDTQFTTSWHFCT